MPEPLGCLDCLQHKSHEEIELARRSRQIDRLNYYYSGRESLASLPS